MNDTSKSSPVISVIVPVFNGEDLIGDCIESLLAVDYPRDRFEIIIVDNNSTDSTREIVGRYPVILHQESIQGAGAARQAGVMISRGDIIATTDADCVVEPGWAKAIEKTFNDPDADAAIGFADGINKNIHARFFQKRWEESWFKRTPQGLVLKHSGIDSRNCAFRRDVLLRCGSFDPRITFCADLHLSLRLNAAKCHIVFAPDMRVWHKNPTAFDVILNKSDDQLAVVLQMRNDLPPGLEDRDVPFPKTAFLGIAGRSYNRLNLKLVIGFLALLRGAVLATTRLGMALRLDNPVTFKLYKIFFGIAYDLAILRDRRDRTFK